MAGQSHAGKGWLEAFNEQFTAIQHQELAEALGFDPSAISREQLARAYEVTNFIFEDEQSRSMLARFAGQYVKVQNRESILYFTGAMAFEIVFAALLVVLTGGAGLAARGGAAAARLSPLLLKLGETLARLGVGLKKAKIHRSGRATPAGSGAQTVELPRPKSVTPQPLSKPAKQKKSKNKPPPALTEAEGRPHSILEKPGRTGQYTTYENENTWKQYRGSGKPHGKIERPNVKFSTVEQRHDGQLFYGYDVRPPEPDEFPK